MVVVTVRNPLLVSQEEFVEALKSCLPQRIRYEFYGCVLSKDIDGDDGYHVLVSFDMTVVLYDVVNCFGYLSRDGMSGLTVRQFLAGGPFKCEMEWVENVQAFIERAQRSDEHIFGERIVQVAAKSDVIFRRLVSAKSGSEFRMILREIMMLYPVFFITQELKVSSYLKLIKDMIEDDGTDR